MNFLRVILCLWVEATAIGLAAIFGYVVGRRAGFFQGICRGMYAAGKVLGQGSQPPDFEREYLAAFRRPN